MDEKIGIAVPCFNNLDVLKKTIPLIYRDKYFFVVFDDNSTDGTEKWLKNKFPQINYLKGNGFNWWGGSLAKAIDLCLKNNCDYILSLNADVCITADVLDMLIKSSKNNNSAIVASLVVNINEPNKVAWAGSIFKKIHNLIPIYTSKYIKKAGTDINEIYSDIYDVDEVHGRGVLFPKKVFNQIGNYDFKNFPHYGADSDFSFRAKKSGIRLIVNPKCVSKVFVNNTGMRQEQGNFVSKKVVSVFNYLTKRKNGEALLVLWRLYKRHVPVLAVIPSYLFAIFLNIYRRVLK